MTERIDSSKHRIDQLRDMNHKYVTLAKKAEKIGEYKKAEQLMRAGMRCLDEIKRLS